MKVHPLVLLLLLALALFGAFSIGRQTTAETKTTASNPAALPAPAPSSPATLVPSPATPSQRAEIKTPSGTVTIEASLGAGPQANP